MIEGLVIIVRTDNIEWTVLKVLQSLNFRWLSGKSATGIMPSRYDSCLIIVTFKTGQLSLNTGVGRKHSLNDVRDFCERTYKNHDIVNVIPDIK